MVGVLLTIAIVLPVILSLFQIQFSVWVRLEYPSDRGNLGLIARVGKLVFFALIRVMVFGGNRWAVWRTVLVRITSVDLKYCISASLV